MNVITLLLKSIFALVFGFEGYCGSTFFCKLVFFFDRWMISLENKRPYEWISLDWRARCWLKRRCQQGRGVKQSWARWKTSWRNTRRSVSKKFNSRWICLSRNWSPRPSHPYCAIYQKWKEREEISRTAKSAVCSIEIWQQLNIGKGKRICMGKRFWMATLAIHFFPYKSS